jgi:hypothetical protein
MPIPLGSLAQIGWLKESTYGTKAGNTFLSLPFISESIKANIETARVEVLQGTRSRLYQYEPLSRMTVSGDIELPFILPTNDQNLPSGSGSDAFGALLEAALGRSTYSQSGTPPVTTSVSWALGDTLPSLTIAVDRNTYNTGGGNNYFYYTGCKVNQLTITGEENNVVRVRVSVNGQAEVLTNTAPTFNRPAINTITTAKFWQSQVYLQEGTTSTGVKVRSFEITINNNLITDRYFNNVYSYTPATGETTPAKVVAVVADLPEGRREISGRLELQFDNTKWYEKFLSAAADSSNYNLSLVINLAGSYIQTGTYKATITLPKIVITGETPNVNRPEPLNFTMNFVAYQSSTSNDELRIELAKVS